VFVIKNDVLGQIKWEQMVFEGNPEFGVELQPIDFAGVARAFGAAALMVDNPADCDRVVEQALATPGPVVIEAVVDANEPPLPARIKPEQALHFAESLAKGTKDWQKIVKTVAEDKVRELV
jgi:thiamine pyrophosphate-dependent acetolactate synthase large subunit-like protein